MHKLQVKGESIEQFIQESQDKTRNAKAKSEQAAFLVWTEQLKSDQGMFAAVKISSLGHTGCSGKSVASS